MTFIKTHFLPSQEEAQEHATKERWYNKDEVIYNAVGFVVRTSALADPLPLERKMCAFMVLAAVWRILHPIDTSYR